MMINDIYKKSIIGLLVLIVLTGCSCKEGNNEEGRKSVVIGKEDMVRANQFLVGKDMDLINAYIKRRNWQMDFTKTGLGFEIYENGSGSQVEKGSTITIDYTLSLLDGNICYSSDEDGPRSFRVGQGGVEAGLEEGVLMLREGDRARFILPPFLAHGLIGDQARIPPRAVIIYEVSVLKVSER
jgi:FKBP-type peptidyl-prolyl cis-trans isomerase FkpA